MRKHIPLPIPKKNKSKGRTKEQVKKSANSALSKAKRREQALRRQLKAQENKVNSLQKVKKSSEGDGGILTTDDLDKATPTVKEHIEEDSDIVFAPHPGPQTEFLAATEREVLYGGAAGGGKSYAMLVDHLRYCHHPAHRAILFRKTNDALRELIHNSKMLYPKAFPGVKWSEQAKTWTFPSGAQMWMTYLDRDDDVERYQGQAFNWVGFDELTQWSTPYCWNYLRSRLRTVHEELPLTMRASTNPGGVGSWWVRKMFIEPEPDWGKSFWATDIDTGKIMVDPENGQPLYKRRFIPAKLSDNPTLWRDGQYRINLLSLPEAQRRQLLEGDWDVVEGAAFPEFRRDIHTCAPFEIPKGWTRFRAADWGYSSPACVLWFAIDFDGRLYVYRELYVKGLTADKFAEKVLEMEENDKIRYGYLDSSTWSQRGDVGPSIAEIMIRQGCRWQKADRSKGSRLNGKLEVHRRLELSNTGGLIPTYDENGQENPTDLWIEEKKPGLIIFNTCTNLIRTLPILPLDKTNSEDVDTDAEDHAYDALRYGCASRPMNPRDDFGSVLSAPTSSFKPADSVFGY